MQITYEDKVALNENTEIADINKVKADDMNMIKSVVNANQEDVGDISNLKTEDITSIVNAINELATNKEILYDSETGTTGNVPLSKPITNFKYIEIFFRSDSNNHSNIKVDNPDGKSVVLATYNNSGTTLVLYEKRVTISNNEITVNSGLVFVITSSIQNTAGTSYILIDKVVGYKQIY